MWYVADRVTQGVVDKNERSVEVHPDQVADQRTLFRRDRSDLANRGLGSGSLFPFV